MQTNLSKDIAKNIHYRMAEQGEVSIVVSTTKIFDDWIDQI